MEEKKLLIEIHQMLKKVCDYIDKLESPEYQKKLDEKEFSINVAADLYANTLEKLRHNGNYDKLL